jgi:hypothetical protein
MATGRTCPKYGSDKHTFRSRKQIEATAEKGPELEVKHRCNKCEHEWKERQLGVLRKGPLPEQELGNRGLTGT